MTLERFRCTTPRHLRWVKHTPGPISRAKKRPKKRGDRPFKSQFLSCLTPRFVLRFAMYLKKESILEFVSKKVDFSGQFSPETTTEMTYVAM